MKKVLFATTALVASAGIASAEVKLTGYAEIGVHNSNYSALNNGDGATAGGLIGDGQTRFHSDMDVSFHLSGETDGGLTFGAKIDLDEVSNGINENGSKEAVWVKGAFGSITMGDTDGALDWAMSEVGMGTTLTDEHTTHAGYNGNSGLDGGNDGQVLRYDNTFGDFGVALSAELNDTSTAADTIWGVGVKYNTALGGANLGLGLGYQDDGTNSLIGVSVDAKFDNGFRAILNYTDMDGKAVMGDPIDNHIGIGLGYTTGPLLVTANYGIYSATANNSDHKGYALAVNYDLGGGAVVMAGYSHGEWGSASLATVKDDTGANVALANSDRDMFSLGLGLSF